MKKLFLASLMLFCLCNTTTAQSDKSDINITEVKGNSTDDRDEWRVIHAIFHKEQSQLEVSLSNIGEVTIYVLDSHNRIVTSTVVDTDTPVTEYIDTPYSRGQYCIIIESKSYYGYGFFKIQ
jgi:exoribonuclease II